MLTSPHFGWPIRHAKYPYLHFPLASKIILLLVFFVFASSSLCAADDSVTLLKRNFDSAKSALAAGNQAEAERLYNKTIALALRQVAKLSVSESRFEEAARELEEALKFIPGDEDTTLDASVARFRAGNVQQARELAQSVVSDHPANARAQNALGRIDLFRGDFPAAIHELQASVALDNDLETSYFLGIAYLNAKHFPEAQKWYKHLLETMGESAALHVLIGRAYSIGHFPEPAVAEFRKAIQIDPKYPHAHGLLGYAILEFRGEEAYPQARQEFEKELKFHPDDYNALLLLGISAVALRDFPAAEAALVHATRLRPEEWFAYLYLGETYSETKRLPQAVHALEKYIKLVRDPDEVPREVSRAYFLLGQALRRLGRIEEAQKALIESQHYREAKFRYDVQHIFDEPAASSNGESHHTSDRIAGMVESSTRDEKKATEEMVQGGVKDSPAAQKLSASQPSVESKAAKEYRKFAGDILSSSYNDLGVMRAKDSNFAVAAEFFKQAAVWNPRLTGLDRNLGLACYRAELYADAIAPLERQLTATPGDNLIRQLLGLSYFMTDNHAKTVEVFQPFFKAPPSDPGLLLAWGTALVRMRQSAQAEQIFRLLLEQNGNTASVHFYLGQAYAQQEDYANAITEYRSALQIDPHLPEVHYSLGLVYLRQSQFEPAEGEFRAELETRPDDLATNYHLGYTLLTEGQTDSAAIFLRKVVQAKPDYELARLELGRALLLQGDVAGSIENLEAAKKLAPDREMTYFQLSQAYRRVGRLADAQQALAEYQKLIESNRSKRRETLEAERP
ncbi:MAG: tetratricopeptide repeat protein [Candidatus Acidiferrum sp.]